MKEEFKAAGWRDFAQRYQGTFGWFHTEKKERMLVQLVEVNESSLMFQAKDGMKYFANPDKGNVFEFIPVTKGVYQLGKDVVFVTRKPARQWKRGLCLENTYLYNLVSGEQLMVDFSSVTAVFGGSDGVMLEAFKKDMSPNYVALDNIFSVVANKLMLYNNRVGVLDRAKRQVTMDSPLFKQEVQDLFRSLLMEVFVE